MKATHQETYFRKKNLSVTHYFLIGELWLNIKFDQPHTSKKVKE